MATKPNVKVIKRSERAPQETQETAPEQSAKKSAQETAREMVATVTEWVAEFQQRRRTPSGQALKALFSDATPQPGKA
ncbi:MAG TPA: hypothetical protein VE821_16155 [Pyrinomonadaceae bacterium]|nr:hypothetical protein [Pyrinomonadaceae bacterium]